MSQILMLNVGLHPTLLETRSQVLRTAGYTVASVASIREAENRFLAGDFDVVILCHSIPQEDRRRLVAKLRAHSPLTPLVLVSASGIEKDSSVDAIIGNNPEQLIEELAQILQQREKRHTQARPGTV